VHGRDQCKEKSLGDASHQVVDFALPRNVLLAVQRKIRGRKQEPVKCINHMSRKQTVDPAEQERDTSREPKQGLGALVGLPNVIQNVMRLRGCGRPARAPAAVSVFFWASVFVYAAISLLTCTFE
jgi:hypothetical protein